MKRFYILFVFIICHAPVFAQFVLSGRINHYTVNEQLKINIPTVYGYHEQNSVNIVVKKNGTFSISLPLKKQKFADLIFQGNFHLLLLDPGKNLKIELNEGDKSIKLISGTGLATNSILQAVNIDEYPAFLQTDTYSKLSLTALNTQIVKPYFAASDKKIAIVNQSSIAAADKQLIAAEIKYAAYNNLYELTDMGAENQAVILKMIAGIFNKINVNPDFFPAGRQYYVFANNYLNYKDIQEKFSSNIKGDKTLSQWLLANKFLPNAVTEQLTYQYFLNRFYSNYTGQAEAFAKAYLGKYPTGANSSDIRKKIRALKQKAR